MTVGGSTRTFRRTKSACAAVLVAAAATAAAGQRAADPQPTDWPSYNRTPSSDRFSPLAQINKSNVSRLKQLCVFDVNVDTNFQTGPIVIGRTLYATTDKEIF